MGNSKDYRTYGVNLDTRNADDNDLIKALDKRKERLEAQTGRRVTYSAVIKDCLLRVLFDETIYEPPPPRPDVSPILAALERIEDQLSTGVRYGSDCGVHPARGGQGGGGQEAAPVIVEDGEDPDDELVKRFANLGADSFENI